MPVINGRLVCCTCGNDLGDADDPYRDPDCGVCLEREVEADARADEDDEPTEPSEDDVTADDPGGPFYYLGKRVAENRADLRAWMARQGYWPNVWWISDHGNAHLISASVSNPAED